MRSSRAKGKLPFLPTPPNRWPSTPRAPPAIARRLPHGRTGPAEVAPRQMQCEEQRLEPRPAGHRHPQAQGPHPRHVPLPQRYGVRKAAAIAAIADEGEEVDFEMMNCSVMLEIPSVYGIPNAYNSISATKMDGQVSGLPRFFSLMTELALPEPQSQP